MVTLVVATTIDPASIGPASALLSMPGWYPGPLLQDMSSFTNRAVRLLKHDKSIVREDHLDKCWEEATGEVVDEVIFLSKHTAASNHPALTVHPIGMPHLRQDEVPPAGGKPGWAAPPNPRIGPWLWLLKAIAESHNLTPEFEVTLEATHHGPEINSPTMKGGVFVGHLLSGYSLPMEDLGQSNRQMWRVLVELGGKQSKLPVRLQRQLFQGEFQKLAKKCHYRLFSGAGHQNWQTERLLLNFPGELIPN
ncbi:hypothetical protein ACSBR1_042542 [Camellia fascicularis]